MAEVSTTAVRKSLTAAIDAQERVRQAAKDAAQAPKVPAPAPAKGGPK